jgi:hypothetical protein
MTRLRKRPGTTLEAVERVVRDAYPKTLRASTVADRLGGCDWSSAGWWLREGVKRGRIVATKAGKYTRYSWAGRAA